MYSWAEMRRWCPQLGHTFSARTNRSLMSMCPHSSHFSHASAGISSLTRSDVRGFRSFLNQAIRGIGGFGKGHNLRPPPLLRQPRPRNYLSALSIAGEARFPGDPEAEADGDGAGQQE